MPSLLYARFPATSLYLLATETYPLDLVSGATGAYALRKLAVAYAGAALKVRRSSDDTTQDIGFNGFYLDFAALSAFVGGNNGFVDTWYDQSGNGRNLVQATTTIQPQVVSSGALYTDIGGYPAIDFNGSRYLESAVAQSNFLTASAGTAFQIWVADTASTNAGSCIWGNRGGWNAVLIRDVSGTIHIRGMGFDGTEDYADNSPYATGTSYVTAWQHGGGNLNLYVLNSTAVATVAHGNETTLTANMVVGRDAQVTGNSSIFDGRMAEQIIWNTALSSGDLATIGAALASPYGLTWT